MIAIGIDPSAAKHIYAVTVIRRADGPAVITECARLPPPMGVSSTSIDYAAIERWASFFRSLKEDIPDGVPVAIEDQHIVRVSKTTIRLAQAVGWIMGMATASGHRAELMGVGGWRKRILCPGPLSQSKDAKAVASAFAKGHPKLASNSDAGESALIALAYLHPGGYHLEVQP